MRPPRMTTRRWMSAVAVVAMITGGVVECQHRRTRFHQLAAHYARRELQYSVFSYSGPGGEHRRKRWEVHLRWTAAYRAHCAKMRAKYQRAEKYPWLPVEPDPPPPK
jgi:hypothetical protein